MVKKLIATGIAVTVLGLASGAAFAQTASPTVSPRPTATPSVQGATTVPEGAPATGMAK